MADYIEEYKELRTELRHFLTRRQHNKNFAFIITLGVIGAGLELEHSYALFCVSALIISFLWFDEIRRLRSIWRLSTYIELIIEKKSDDLNWTTYSHKQKFQSSLSRLFANLDIPVLFLLNISLGIIKLYSIYLIFSIILSVIFLTLFVFLLKESFTTSRKGLAQEKENLRNIIASPNKAEENQ